MALGTDARKNKVTQLAQHAGAEPDYAPEAAGQECLIGETNAAGHLGQRLAATDN
jgi:hypothetical protein